jgi:hypothetical protein
VTSGALALEADKEGADVKFDWYLQNPQTNTGDAQTGWVEITDTLDAFVI